jgi:hypothetical protein
MVQTEEEKKARRKARREKRKEASAGLTTPAPAIPGGEQERPVAAQRPYAGFEGSLFEKFISEDKHNPECYRLYTEKPNILGVLEQDPGTKKWFISITRFPQDWEYAHLRFESLDKAMALLYEHYSSLVTADLKINEQPKQERKKKFRRYRK